MEASKLKTHHIILRVIEAFENVGQPLTIEDLAAYVNNLMNGHFSPEMIERTFLRSNPGTFKLLADGRWALTDWEEESAPIETNIISTKPIITRAIPLTPNQAFEHIKESVVQYLETAYRISHPAVYGERGEILRRTGTVAQEPFIESTPAFPTTGKLSELEAAYSFLPSGLAELVQHGVPVDQFALYTHQEEALLAAFGANPSLLVASGTGSGKTETFLLPILADIMKEAKQWPVVTGAAHCGEYNEKNRVWLHSRRHEARPAALRAIILYPMNALVNDQLSRLRRILARKASPQWQAENLLGNVIHFGMYTSLCPQAGPVQDKSRRQKLDEYMQRLEADWNNLRDDLRDTGFWPRPDSPEMLNRWDMQAAPPDILVTNYSMLEYMLVRPIEDPIFQMTREWLEKDRKARLTLVLDEAHTYTGAAGTEVAHLVRRLKERLGLESGSPQFRAIATTASLPNDPSAESKIRTFISDLFGEPEERFTLIQLKSPQANLAKRAPAVETLDAFSDFQTNFDLVNPAPAIEQLAQSLKLGDVDKNVAPQVALYSLLERNEDIGWLRQRTARNATLLDRLADEVWGDLRNQDIRQRAIAGMLSAGSFARPMDSTDVPPLLSVRIHAFFRGISGLWACMDPACSAVDDTFKLADYERPIGKLYTEPRPWCDCGARVLELFSCRHCGLLFLGGIPDQTNGSLWPWADDLSGTKQNSKEFHIFGVETPHRDFNKDNTAFRSTRTTLPVHQNEPFTRPVYEVEKATEKDDDKPVSNYPQKCPRCQNYRQPGPDGREVIENLRTKGPQSFALIVEDGFRVQPRASQGKSPNYGRKALLFSDSRQEAAKLAGDLNQAHRLDLFRQLLYRALFSCASCDGTGEVEEDLPFTIGQNLETVRKPCTECKGSGIASQPAPVDYESLCRRVVELQIRLGINPTWDDEKDYFALLAAGDQDVYKTAQDYFDLSLRRELTEDEFALDPLGLASWHVQVGASGNFAPLLPDETKIFLRSVARILATEKILLPPEPKNPWDWPDDKVRSFERRRIFWGEKGLKNNIPYNLWQTRKLGRYVHAVSRALVKVRRFKNNSEADKWINDLRKPLWDALRGLKILVPAGRTLENQQLPYGIRLNAFSLHPIGTTVYRCKACRYVMCETVLNVCTRCGQDTESLLAEKIHNYYRRGVLLSDPTTPFEDPFPLRAAEHTAQIQGSDARNYERWFQDLFHDDQNPRDKRIDVLSVTTTMEMGIDIGSLLCVGMRNIPPSVSNYQQRAGRAGRRGSSIATVLAFANQRSHDQYYFSNPPEIVSRPPRIPALYLGNIEIAHRHVRARVLQDFFLRNNPGNAGGGLFKGWGVIGDFANKQTANKLHQYLATNRAPLLERLRKIINQSLHTYLDQWLDNLVSEVQQIVNSSQINDDLFVALIDSGLLPKYAFPIDVVSLNIPTFHHTNAAWGGEAPNNAMQRELPVALSEYAPGSQIIRMEFPKTYKYTSVGLYDPFQKNPDYHPQGKLLECLDCQSIDLILMDAQPPDMCQECGSPNLAVHTYLRPPGFTVNSALEHAGAEDYNGGGVERAGSVSPARLLVGKTSFNTGQPRIPFAPKLYTHVRVGDLFTFNKGPNPDHPGFLICHTCGRALDPEDPQSHSYPANIPPHYGKTRGPRAGDPCPNRFDFRDLVLLGHRFHSEVILLGTDLPPSLDASFYNPAGRAIWYSFGTLLANASALHLQIDPDEIKVGVRAIRRGKDRIHGEIYLYDDVPGGAGYARAIDQYLEQILKKALELGSKCANPDCQGACYRCMFDYRNQMIHPLLDRNLGVAVLRYILRGEHPTVDQTRIDYLATGLAEYARANWTIMEPTTIGNQYLPLVLRDRSGQRIGLWVTHPLQSRPSAEQLRAITAQSGIRPAVHNTFDLERRPFWVMDHLLD